MPSYFVRLAASKCAKDKNIYLWKLSAHLNKATSDQRKVETLAALEWAETNVDYINIGSTNGCNANHRDIASFDTLDCILALICF